MAMKFKKEWFFGGDKRINGDSYISDSDDFISAYVADNGTRIEIEYSPYESRTYVVNGKKFYYLKDAKAFAESII